MNTAPFRIPPVGTAAPLTMSVLKSKFSRFQATPSAIVYPPSPRIMSTRSFAPFRTKLNTALVDALPSPTRMLPASPRTPEASRYMPIVVSFRNDHAGLAKLPLLCSRNGIEAIRLLPAPLSM